MSRSPVAHRFGRAAAHYHEAATVQHQVAADLVALLPEAPCPARVIDIGCGTGALTERLHRHWPHAELHGFDLSPEMVGDARVRLPQTVRLWQADAADWAPEPPGYDWVCSSSALHWLEDPLPLLHRLRTAAPAGGRLAMAVMLEGTWSTLHRLRAEIDPDARPQAPRWNAKKWQQAVIASGWKIGQWEHHRYPQEWADGRAVLRYAHRLGVTGGFPSHQGRVLSPGRMKALINALDAERGNGPVRMDYSVGLLVTE